MSRLNYHHLYYFWQVARVGNLTKAAQAQHVSQSALSTQIRQLEDSMGVILFDRVGRSLTLTEAGQRTFLYAEDIFSKGEELENLLRNGALSTLQTLHIGTLATMSRNFIESFIEPMIPRTELSYSLHARQQPSLLADLSNHQLDLGLTNIEVPGGNQHVLQCQLLARQPVSVIGPSGLALGKSFSKRYRDMSWVLPASEIPFRSAFESFCAQHQFIPKVVAEADDMAMLRLLARDTHALTVLPSVVVKDELASNRLTNYMELPNVYENFFAVTVKRQYRHQLTNELISSFLERSH